MLFLQVIRALASSGEWQQATSYYTKMRDLGFQIPGTLHDEVVKVCEANSAPVDLGPRPVESKVRRQDRRRSEGGVVDVNIEAVVSTAF